ncbi:sodium/glutamate symporter [Gracilibacillus salinarum]|uniref:Sodium:glutamate symporter n=1 Tax=Gracilibacillus salinarum TaxID=2932255 RepID=A0ABY4GTM6_9BACI|nr:sodium/glutamate symporter [Gracilibacillus salinarum]UOQ87546.1 sodium:glutamate symporter [Gracilibacillus salinarum]
MIAFGLASIMLCLGVIGRAKIPFFKNMLVPASVIGGILGIVVMNVGMDSVSDPGVFTTIVTHLFTLSFISIGLTNVRKSKESKGSKGKEIAKGALGMGILWTLLYALTPAVGIVIILAIGGQFNMDPFYGLLIPFAFTQGPGQAATFGTIFEQQYGIENAAMVGMTFAAIGFIFCFLVGVPLAKYGLKKGLAKNFGQAKIDQAVERGYYVKSEQEKSLGKETIYSGNMDTMTFHFAIMGVCYIMALGLSWLMSFVPGIGASMSAMLFVHGLVAAYIVKAMMKKLGIDYLLNNTFQSKITGWATDYLIVCSFMAVQFSIIGEWLIPILIESIIITVVTVLVVVYFGQRLGGEDDFGRTLGLFGAATATTPSGIALVRMIDPSLKSATPVELGMMNVFMTFSFVTVLTIMGIGGGTLSMTIGILLLIAPIPVYLIILKIFKVWGKKTYQFNTKVEPVLEKKKSAV